MIPVHGLDLKLHEKDVAAGAGKAFLYLMASPIHVIDGRGRTGDATGQEAQHSLRLGHNVGIILKPEHYDPAFAFLAGKSNQYPEGLPAYWGSLELEPDDLIRGADGLPDWLLRQRRSLNAQSFRARSPDGKTMSLALYYAFVWANKQGEDLSAFDELAVRFS
jgi:hypothetical protein